MEHMIKHIESEQPLITNKSINRALMRTGDSYFLHVFP